VNRKPVLERNLLPADLGTGQVYRFILGFDPWGITLHRFNPVLTHVRGDNPTWPGWQIMSAGQQQNSFPWK
jgi:hypothetical protein